MEFNKIGFYISIETDYGIGYPNIHHYIGKTFNKKDIDSIDELVADVYNKSINFSKVLISLEIFSKYDIDIELIKNKLKEF